MPSRRKKGVLFTLTAEAQSRSRKTNVRLRNFKFSSVARKLATDPPSLCFAGLGRSVPLLLYKCVGAKCTKRCCRVQQRSARRSFSTQRSPLCAMSNSALCTFNSAHGQFINPFGFAEVRKSMKGGLCDKNVFTAFGA